MNLQEINETGNLLWVFAVTAVGLTNLALGVWGLLNLGLRIRAFWQRLEDFSECEPWANRIELMW